MKRATFAAILLASGVFGQAPAAKPEFEVADIRQNKTDENGRANILPGGQIGVRNLPMKEFLKFAYDVQDDGILGGPAWFDTDRFDVTGKATPGTPDEVLRLMLQNFLAKEFKLTAHMEERPRDVYAMIVGKAGAKLKAAAGTGKLECRRRVGGGQDPAAKDMPPGLAELVCTNITTADIARALPQFAPGYADHPVVDLTELKGRYDLTLSWTSRQLIDQGGLTLFDAVDKQLGLKLEARKMPQPVVVIDHAEKLADDR